MKQLVRGFRGKLSDFMNPGQSFQVKIRTIGSAVYDTCCFGVDIFEKLSDDRYMIFYNQTASPEKAIEMTAQNFHVKLQFWTVQNFNSRAHAGRNLTNIRHILRHIISTHAPTRGATECLD